MVKCHSVRIILAECLYNPYLISIPLRVCPYKKWHQHTFFLNTFHQLT